MSIASILINKHFKITAINGVCCSIAINKISNDLTWQYFSYVVIAIAACWIVWLWRKRLHVQCSTVTIPDSGPDCTDGDVPERNGGDVLDEEKERPLNSTWGRYFRFLWFLMLNGALLGAVIGLSISKYCDNTTHAVYYENYVLNYGLPMGTGCATNRCVGGWYKFEFVGSHGCADQAKCLYGENRRYKLDWFDRYRTLRSVTQVNGADQPLWFCEDGNEDCSTPIFRFYYATQSDLASAGAIPARLQVFAIAQDQLRGLVTGYVLNYWDRWGEVNALVSLTKGDTNERYFVPGRSYDQRTSYPGKSNVSGYAVRWDDQGRQIERKCKAGCDVDGVVRKTYEYKTLSLVGGEPFSYLSCVKSFGFADGEEVVLGKHETVWDGLMRVDRYYRQNECSEVIRKCRSHSVATVERQEQFDVDERFERVLDSDGNPHGCTSVYRYDATLNLIGISYFHDLGCRLPFRADEESYAHDVYTWTSKGWLASHETLDEKGEPIVAMSIRGKRLSKVEYQYGNGTLITLKYVGTNLVSTGRSYLPGYRDPAKEHEGKTTTTTAYDGAERRIVEVDTSAKDGAKKCNERGYSKVRYVYFKPNRDEDIHPNGKIEKMEFVMPDDSLSTNNVSKYYTYQQGMLVRVDNKIGVVENGAMTTNQMNYYVVSTGGYVPAVTIYEYDDCNRICCEWFLDCNGETNSLPRDMVFNVVREYDGDSLSPFRTIETSGVGVWTNELVSSEIEN